MIWYFALNEAGTKNATGAYARLAVLSARRFTDLEPHLLYLGRPNAETAWMERQGVRVVPVELRIADAIEAAVAARRYPAGMEGHWLRTEIGFVETTDQFVLYTDCDVVFLAPVVLDAAHPVLLAAAPEFRPDAWAYFNSGVMLLNAPQLRARHPGLEAHVRARLATQDCSGWHDQEATNEVFAAEWERLDPVLNWKPYWGPNRDVRILHFHGPKLHCLAQMLDYNWDWGSEFGRSIGSIALLHLESYTGYLRGLRALLPDETAELAPMIEYILAGETRLRATAPWHLVRHPFG